MFRVVQSNYDENGNANAQFYNASAVTPSDSTVITITGGLYIGGTGNVAVVMNNGATVTFSGVPVGTILPISVTKVKATGTTATNIIALY